MVTTDEVESTALQQLQNIAQLPFIYSHIAAIPDVHAGIGATVGSVIPTKGAIIPAAVGVDIGCGMNAVRLSLTANDLPDSMKPVRAAIEAAIPVGFDLHKAPSAKKSTLNSLQTGLDAVWEKHPAISKMIKRPQETWACQLGSLGGGNHVFSNGSDSFSN